MLQSVSIIEERLKQSLPPEVFPPLSARYHEEPRGRYKGAGGLLVAPRTVQQVSKILKLCHAEHVPVVPYGGGSGLVGGQIQSEDIPAGVILSLENLDKIRSLDPISDVVVVEAGVILQDLQQEAQAQGRLFPLSLAARGTARIGGNLATNAGGLNVLRYGNARDLCLGLEVVTPQGKILSNLSGLRKDNTGYDLKSLMIGSEGTLGVITAAALKLYPRPKSEAAALFVVPDPKAALSLYARARDCVGEALSAFELISGQGLAFLEEVGPEVKMPFGTHPEWSVLLDVGLARGNAQEAVLEIFEAAQRDGIVLEGVLSQSEAQRAELWAIRESLPDANRRIGSVSSHDISVPLGAIPEFIATAPSELGKLGRFRVNCFGHIGDGNLHWNVFALRGKTRADHEDQRQAIKQCVHDHVHRFGGSVAAEHGVGRLKVEDLERYASTQKLDMMRTLKEALDPHSIMNPGAVLRHRGSL